jgi:hypothetical protein
MKIAFIVSKFPALPETFIFDQVTGLIDAGCDVRVFAPRGEGGMEWADESRAAELKKRSHIAGLRGLDPRVSVKHCSNWSVMPTRGH